MSNPIPISDLPDMTGFPTFVWVIDGEIVDVSVIRPGEPNDRKIAILSSDPKIYVLPGGFPADGRTPQIGSSWPLPSNLNVEPPTE